MDTRKIHIALENIDNALYGIVLKHIRTVNAYMLTPILKITGFRFSKDYRYCSPVGIHGGRYSQNKQIINLT